MKDPLRLAVATLCTFEVVAITTRRLPTLSQLTRRHPGIGIVLLAGLAAHFYVPSNEGEPCR